MSALLAVCRNYVDIMSLLGIWGGRLKIRTAGSNMGVRVNIEKLQSLIDRYGTQSAAADAWDLQQPDLSRMIKGRRKKVRRTMLEKIAGIEGIPVDELIFRPTVVDESTDVEPMQAHFIYDVDKPHEMLFQVETWFAEMAPETPRIRRQVVKSVMRTLMDESFVGPQRPSREWRAVMDHTEGWTTINEGRDRRLSS